MFGSSAKPDSEWSTSGVNAMFWPMACKEVTEATALPANVTFDQLLKSNRS
nr:hypothetical protein WG33_0392 [uncultured bacterium]